MISVRRFAQRSAAAAALVALLPALPGALALLSPGAAQAQQQAPAGGQEAFTVSGVSVDVTATDANAARDRAILMAQRKAWEELFRQLLPPGGKAPAIADAELSRAVQNFSVDDEQLAPGRYKATMTVRFAPAPVRAALAGSGVANYAEPANRPLVLLPLTVYPNGSAVLWEDRTAWRAAWEARDNKPGALVPLTVPDGELSDIAAAGAPEALAGDVKAFAKIAGLHGAGGVVVVKTTLGANGPDVSQPLRIDVALTTLDGISAAKTVTVRADAADRPEDILSRAVISAAAAVDELWRQEHTVAAGPQQTLTADVLLSGLSDWVAARQKLAQIGGGARVDMLTLTRNSATVSIAHRGADADLRDRLAKQGLTLAQGGTGWVISLPQAPLVPPPVTVGAGASPAPAGAPPQPAARP